MPSTVRQNKKTGDRESKVVAEKTAGKSPDTGKNVEFRIQIATSANDLPETSKIFSQFNNVKNYHHQGLNKYTVGNYTDLAKAKGMLEEVKKKGYHDAFIVIFRSNERIPQAEAESIMRK